MPLDSASFLALASARTLKPITTALDAMARLMSLSEMPPTAACTTCTRTSSVDSGQRLHQRFLRALDVGLDDQRQGLRAFAQVVEHGFQLGGLLASQLDVAELALAEQRDFARLALVGQHHQFVAGGRDFGQALDFHGDRRTGFLDGLAVLVQHGAHAAEAGAGQHHVAAMQRAALHQDGGDRAAALVQAGFDDQALGGGVDRRLPVPALRLAAGRSRADRRCLRQSWRTRPRSTPYSSGTTSSATSSCLTRSGLALGLSILVMATTMGTPAAFAWWMASRVCGITPSSAAHTRMTMSVALAPRARMAVNASWPGVSRKVTMPRSVSTW